VGSASTASVATGYFNLCNTKAPTIIKSSPRQAEMITSWPLSVLLRTAPLQVLTTVKAYPVETDIVIVTNKPNRMHNYRRGVFDDASIYQVVGVDNRTDPYGMTWAHRDIATKAMAEGA
jgi:hypothetical protein